MMSGNNAKSGFELSKAQAGYLEAQLNRVSRSFAIVAACLEQPLRAELSAAYLLCRVADNIEDCTESAAWKAERFAEFERLLGEPDRAPEYLTAWEARRWSGLTDDERRLMGRGAGTELWHIYAAILPDARAIIRRWIWTMADGMAHLDGQDCEPIFIDVDEIKVLARPADYNQYCYIAAGTVGHMATELVIHHLGITGAMGDRLLGASEACGRALQKTNILKDFVEDLERGICYLPDQWLQMADRRPLALAGAPLALKRTVLEDIVAELETAMQYVVSLPVEATGYREATLLCFLPAWQTNLLAVQEEGRLFTPGHHYEISRMTLGKCFGEARSMAGDNARILAYSQRVQEEIRGRLGNGVLTQRAPQVRKE